MPTFFEDFAVGQVEEFGRYEVTEEEILEFAGRYDPQWRYSGASRTRTMAARTEPAAGTGRDVEEIEAETATGRMRKSSARWSR